jgi:hypothetical protein
MFFSLVLLLSMFYRALTLQLNAVEELQDHPLLTRTAKGTKDANTILKAFRNISNLCDVFQVSIYQYKLCV